MLDYDYYFKLVESFRTGDIPGALLLYRDVRAKGFDSLFFLNGLADHVRNLMVAADPRTAELLETSRDVAERYTQQAKSLPLQWYYAAMKVLNDGDVQYRTATNKQFLVELALIRLSQLLKPATPPFDLVDRDYPLGDITGAARTQSVQAAPPQSTPPAQTTPEKSEISEKYDKPEKYDRPEEAAPMPAPQGAPQRRRRNPTPGFRINDDSVEQKKAQYEEQRREHREAVDLERFMQAWTDYQQANSQQHILMSAMRNSKPQQTAPEEFLAMVGHPAEVQAFELAMQQLMTFLRQRLGNDFLTLRIEIDPARAVSKQLAPYEFLKESVEKNPALGDLLRKLDAELA
ncbi:MAG: hypothetical protein K2L00_10135 [Muribaculaceae bacterium]|nr:hypothetical protein [Muribaculaceae bacterium]